MNKKEKINELVQQAHKAGASEVAIVSAKEIVVDDTLAKFCLKPRCENYGLSKSCPPHVGGPDSFRKQLENFEQALFIKIEVPSEILFSNERREVFQLLHEVGAGIEQAALQMGFTRSQAYAGGSCKFLFCYDHSDCRALSEKGSCRNPQSARPSMSGFGIHVAKLVETAGWSTGGATLGIRGTQSTGMGPDTVDTKTSIESETVPMSPIYALVLID